MGALASCCGRLLLRERRIRYRKLRWGVWVEDDGDPAHDQAIYAADTTGYVVHRQVGCCCGLMRVSDDYEDEGEGA